MTRKRSPYHVVTFTSDKSDIGIYTSWLVCKRVTNYVSGATYHGVESLEEALHDMATEGFDSPRIFHDGKIFSKDNFRKSTYYDNTNTPNQGTTTSEGAPNLGPPLDDSLSKLSLLDLPVDKDPALTCELATPATRSASYDDLTFLKTTCEPSGTLTAIRSSSHDNLSSQTENAIDHTLIDHTHICAKIKQNSSQGSLNVHESLDKSPAVPHSDVSSLNAPDPGSTTAACIGKSPVVFQFDVPSLNVPEHDSTAAVSLEKPPVVSQSLDKSPVLPQSVVSSLNVPDHGSTPAVSLEQSQATPQSLDTSPVENVPQSDLFDQSITDEDLLMNCLTPVPSQKTKQKFKTKSSKLPVPAKRIISSPLHAHQNPTGSVSSKAEDASVNLAINSLKNQTSVLDGAVTSIMQDFASKFDTLSQQIGNIGNLVSEATALTGNVKGLENTVEALTGNFKGLENTVETYSKRISEATALTGNVRGLETTVEALTGNIKGLENTVETNIQRIKTISREVAGSVNNKHNLDHMSL